MLSLNHSPDPNPNSNSDSSFLETFLGYLGLASDSPSQRLYKEGGEYLVTDLAKISQASPHGFVTVELPFSWFFSRLPNWLGGNQIRYITVITDPRLARAVGNYGVNPRDYDEHTRLIYQLTDLIMSNSIVTQNDPQVKEDRRDMKKIMHNFDHSLPIIQSHFQNWLRSDSSKISDLEHDIKTMMIKILGQTLLGFKNFPPKEDLDQMIEIIDHIDAAMLTFDKPVIEEYTAKLWDYSKWFYEHNYQSSSNQQLPNIFRHLVRNVNPDNLEDVNLTAAFLVTPNVTKLVYLTIIFMSCPDNKQHQMELRQALFSRDKEKLNRIYRECCRLFIPTNIPRFASRPTTFLDHQFPADTMFYVLGRAMRMDPRIFPDPHEFQPDRYLDNPKLKINSIELSPFGIGPRQCPAASQFTERFWMEIMTQVFQGHEITITNHEAMEPIPENARHIKLQNQYQATIKEIITTSSASNP